MRIVTSPLASFFSIEVRQYENINFDHATARTVTTVVIGVCLGVILAALYNFYVRRVPGGVVRLLLERGATSPETALSAAELGLLNKPFSLWELMRGISLRRLVRTVEPVEADGEEKVENADPTAEKAEGTADATAAKTDDAQATADDETREERASEPQASGEAQSAEARFYIPAECKDRAEIRFAKKGNGVVGLLVTVALSFLLGFLILKLIPVALGMIDGML